MELWIKATRESPQVGEWVMSDVYYRRDSGLAVRAVRPRDWQCAGIDDAPRDWLRRVRGAGFTTWPGIGGRGDARPCAGFMTLRGIHGASVISGVGGANQD
jgi:hypothetical protein